MAEASHGRPCRRQPPATAQPLLAELLTCALKKPDLTGSGFFYNQRWQLTSQAVLVAMHIKLYEEH